MRTKYVMQQVKGGENNIGTDHHGHLLKATKDPLWTFIELVPCVYAHGKGGTPPPPYSPP